MYVAQSISLLLPSILPEFRPKHQPVKRIFTLLSLLFSLTNTVDAQWSFDPLNPLVFCDAPFNQFDLQSVPDGDGGLFSFWLDARTGSESTKVFGQHFDANGNILWEINGKLILDEPGEIRKFKLYHYEDDKLIVVWYNYNAPLISDNKLLVQQIDDDGNKMWVDDLEISHANTNESSIVWYYNEFDLVRDEYGFHIGFLISNGSGYQYNLSRFTFEGILTTPLHGVMYGNGYNGFVRMLGNQEDGVYLFRPTGNGSGAPLKCAYIDTLASPKNTAWLGWITVTDAPGLNYGYDAIADKDGITFMWEGENTIKTNRIDTAGAFIWGVQPKLVCTAPGNEIGFTFKENNGDYFAVWKDNRPGIVGNYAIYGQRFNQNGDMLWGSTGAEIANTSNFNPFAKFTFDEDSNLVVCHNSNLGLRKHIISSQGIQILGGNGGEALTGNVQPNEDDYELIRLNNHIILGGMWYYPGNNNVFLSCIDGCAFTSFTETISSCSDYTFYGQNFTESGIYEVEIPGDTIVTLNLTINQPVASVILSGDTLIAESSEGAYSWWNCDTQIIEVENQENYIPEINGNYALILDLNGCSDTSDCVNVIISGVNDLNDLLDINVFPNPGSDVLSISSSQYLQNTWVFVYNFAGQLVLNPIKISGNSLTIHTEELLSGIYQVVLFNGNNIAEKRWMKN